MRERFEVGRGTYGGPTVLHWGESATLRIGSFCSIAGGVTIFLGGNHRTDWITTYPFPAFWECAKGIKGHPQTKGHVIIGNDVWIAQDVTILSGVTIGDGAVLAAQSVVTKDVTSYMIVAGNPARPVRKRFTDEKIMILERISWWNWSDAKIEKAVPFLLSDDVSGLLKFASVNAEMA